MTSKARTAPVKMQVAKTRKDMILSKTKFASGGARAAGDEAEMEILWKEFRKCYPSEEMATTAAERNSAVFNPQLNSPTKIKGTNALLRKRFGKKGALEVITKNPGILICTPRSLETQTDKAILDAANLVETLDNNKELIQAISKLTGVLLIFFITYGIATKQAELNGSELSIQAMMDSNPYLRK